jgi:hypothetical protein
MKDILPITLPGAALVAGVGLLMLAGAQVLHGRNIPGIHMVCGGLQVVGLIALVLGVATGVIHIWGRRRSGELR